MRSKIWLEIALALCLLLGVVGLSVPVYFDFVEAKTTSWSKITHRVMDSMAPFQARFHETNARFAFGVFDRTAGDQSLLEATGWKPSVTDSNKYVAHVVGTNAYKVVATSTTGESLCRMYPAKQPCFDLEAYHRHGH